ncbi:efflux RND transporter periplasmic adaptor subunit [Pseudoxanthomonas sp.]|uniref:efflux RND transporter periplasmic adaptor subunit n=1 Tax=Pseudoxanthomonas sp. TaxID=1871049 RepID=UPI0035B47D38
MIRRLRCAALLGVGMLVAACGSDEMPVASETVAQGPLTISVRGEGELRSAKPTPLNVPGKNWAQRQVEWMLPEGSLVKKGDVLARFVSPEGEQQLAQAMIDLQRNALARAAKESGLESAQGRVEVDLSRVAVQLGIAQRYAGADLSTVARNQVLDAIEDREYLQVRQGVLQWQRDQSGVRGGAELAVLDAQRATFDMNAKTRKDDLEALELRAPNDGVLLLAANWSGDKPTVGANLRAGFEFGSLPDTSTMEVEIDLPQIEAQGVQAGDAVVLHPLGRPDQRIDSRLSWVASAAKVRNRESPVKFLSMRAPIPADAIERYRLIPGQRFAASVVLLDAKNAMAVPNVAIEQRDDRHWVQVKQGNDYVSREVKLGVRGTARSQVLSGLKPGEQVRLSQVEVPAPGDDGSVKDKDAGDAGGDGKDADDAEGKTA